MRADGTGRVVGIILAAGMSTRMGQLKQLLPLGGRAAIEWIAEVVGQRLDEDEVVVVLGHRAEEIAPVLAAYPVRWVVNADYQTGMLSSVQCAVRAVDTEADYLICLGDQPRLSGAVVEQVLQARKQVGAGIIIPTANGKRGHPVLIRNAYRAEILGLPLDVGLNAVTRGHPEDTYELPVAEDAILTDMDTPADYQRELEQWPE
ncbi:MAG: nucleotidyltransferase family protein [Gemmatimonadota bacterium]|nr:nucleotidyltransferase family protein [Gemmatimonadota bacterium]